jgi:hypothetical protein
MDDTVVLVKAGVLQSDDRALAAFWPMTLMNQSYGSSSDPWSDTWSASDINDVGFGAALAVVRTNGGAPGAFVDSLEITIDYDDATPSPTSTPTHTPTSSPSNTPTSTPTTSPTRTPTTSPTRTSTGTTTPTPNEFENEGGDVNCSDEFDNDFDGATDCDDSDCDMAFPCVSPAPAMGPPMILILVLVLTVIGLFGMARLQPLPARKRDDSRQPS